MPSKPSSWVVHKFGGTSVASAERYRGVAPILKAERASASGTGAAQGVVVSAMSKVTDALLDLVSQAARRDESYLKASETLEKRHLDTVESLLAGEANRAERERLGGVIRSDFRDIREILRAVWLARSSSMGTAELVSGFGEIWSAQFLCAYLNSIGTPSRWLDARQVLIVEPGERAVTVQWLKSREKLSAWLSEARNFSGSPEEVLVITGFVASTPDGVATTLKRNGSDYSASIFGALLEARAILIWTDVDGVLSADPRLVPDAVILDELSYQEATELAYFGAKVVHPSTMAPAIEKSIPIWIRNTFRPEVKGTVIQKKATSRHPVKGFATIDEMALLNVEGTGMIGVPGVAEKLFGALKDVGVSVVMISQASSEHSICFAIPEKQADLARSTVEKAFFGELHQGQIQTLDVTRGCSILAAVGDTMVETPGVAGRLFTALGKAGVNIRAIAQGSSERNISAVIDSKDATRALRTVHSAFYLSNQTLSIGVIGPGLIGGTFLRQLGEQIEKLKRERHIDIRVRGIMDSKKMLLSESGLDLRSWKDEFARSTRVAVMDEFVGHVNASYLPHSVLIDATSSAELTRNYPMWLESGISIITPNKKGNTGSLDFYRQLRKSARSTNRYYLYDTTVGAGLPVIHTLRELIQTGDEVISIEGILSGTLSYLFNSYDGSRPFSEIVFEAKAKGYTEPDPRDDLSGMDVARKLTILGREMGLALELSDVKVESLVPEALRAGDIESYLKKLPEHDAAMAALHSAASAQGEVLRFVGVIDQAGKASVSLKRYPRTHAFARLNGSDNIVAFTTVRYRTQPLIVQGPGAGPEVTAGGVFANLLKLASYLGAPV